MAGTIYVTVLEVSQLTEESRPGHSAIVRSASAPGISNGQSEFKTAAVREIEANMATMHGAWYPGKHFQRLVSPLRTQTSGVTAAAALGLRLGDREFRTSPVPGGSGRVGEAFVFRFTNQASDVLTISAHANDARSVNYNANEAEASTASATAMATQSLLPSSRLSCSDKGAWFAGGRGALPCGVCALPLARFPVATRRSSSASPNNAATISHGNASDDSSSKSSRSSSDQSLLGGQDDGSNSGHSSGAQKGGHKSGCSSDHVEKWFSLLHPINPADLSLKAAVKLRLQIVLDADVDEQPVMMAATGTPTHLSSSVFSSSGPSPLSSGLPPLNTTTMMGASSFDAAVAIARKNSSEYSDQASEPPSPSSSPPVLDPGGNTGHHVLPNKTGAGFKRPPSPRLLSSPRPGGSTSLRSSGSSSRHASGRSPRAGMARSGTRKSLPPNLSTPATDGGGGDSGSGDNTGAAGGNAVAPKKGDITDDGMRVSVKAEQQEVASAQTEGQESAEHEVALDQGQIQRQPQRPQQQKDDHNEQEQQRQQQQREQEQEAAADLAWCGAQVMPSGLVDYLAIVRGRPANRHHYAGSEEVKDPHASVSNGKPPLQVCDAVVTERWPREDSAAAVPFPAKLEWFCFPGGWRPITRRHNLNRPKSLPKTKASTPPPPQLPPPPPAPRSTTFCLQLGGTKAWGVCAVGFERKPHPQWVAHSSLQEPENKSSDSTSTSSSSSSSSPSNTAESEPGTTHEWWPVCICLLTRLPVVSALKAWLRDFLEAVLLHNRFKSDSKKTALASRNSSTTPNPLSSLQSSLLSWLAPRWAELALLLPHPIEGRLAVTADPFGLGRRFIYGDLGGGVCTMSNNTRPPGQESNGVAAASRSRTRPPPPLPSLPHDPNDCRQALACLGSPKLVLEVIACLLGERKVLLHSKTLNVLPPLADLLVSLLYPLPWPHAFVPVLPRPMLGILAAPTPFLLGVHTSWLRELEASPEVAADLLADVVLVDVDCGQLDFSYCAILSPSRPQGGTSSYQNGTIDFSSGSSAAADAAPPLLPPSVERCLLEALQEYLMPDGQPSDNPRAFLVVDDQNGTTVCTTIVAADGEEPVRTTRGGGIDGIAKGGASQETTASGYADDAQTMMDQNIHAQGKRLAALRFSFAWALSSLFQDVEKCVFWVDTAWPVFDAARFLSACTLSHDVPALRGMVATQSFHLLLESLAREPTLAFFRYAIAKQRVDSASSSKGGGRNSNTSSASSGPCDSSSSSSSSSDNTVNTIDVELEHGVWSVPWCLNVPAPTDNLIGAFRASTQGVSSSSSSSGLLSRNAELFSYDNHDSNDDAASLEALVNLLPDDDRGNSMQDSWLAELRLLGVESAAECALLAPSELHEVVGMPLPIAEQLHAAALAAAAEPDTEANTTVAAAAADVKASTASYLGVFPSESLLNCDWLDDVARQVDQQVMDTQDPHQAEKGDEKDGVKEEADSEGNTPTGLKETTSKVVKENGGMRTSIQTTALTPGVHIRPPPLSLSVNSDDFHEEGQNLNDVARSSSSKLDICWTVEAVAAVIGASLWDLVPPDDDEYEIESNGGADKDVDGIEGGPVDEIRNGQDWPLKFSSSQEGSSTSSNDATPSTPPRNNRRRSITKSISDSLLSNSSSSSSNDAAMALTARSPRNRKLNNPSSLLPLSPGMSSNPYNLDQQSSERDLSVEEQRLLQCVALALSGDKGPSSALLAATRADLHVAGEDRAEAKKPARRSSSSSAGIVNDTGDNSSTSPNSFAVAERLLRILERMHTQQDGPVGSSSSSGGSSQGQGQHGKSRRLPRAGFECLAALCDSALVAAAQRERWAFPFALLRAAAFYHQDLAATSTSDEISSSSGNDSGGIMMNLNGIGGSSGNSSGGVLKESLGARVSEHRVFVDPLLWEAELKHQLLSFAGGTRGWNHPAAAPSPSPLPSAGDDHSVDETSSENGAVATEGSVASLVAAGADPRTVVQQLTALIFAMRAVRSMTPHRAALFVRRVVRGYGLAESHARALLAVVRAAWRDVVHLPPSAFDDVAWLHNPNPNQHHQQHHHQNGQHQHSMHPPLALSSSPVISSLSVDLEGLLFGGNVHSSFDYSHQNYSKSSGTSSSSDIHISAIDKVRSTSSKSSSYSSGSNNSAKVLNGSPPCASATVTVPLICLAAWSDYATVGCADGTVRAAPLLANQDKCKSSNGTIRNDEMTRSNHDKNSSCSDHRSVNANGTNESDGSDDANITRALSAETALHDDASELTASSLPSPMPPATLEPLEMEDETYNVGAAPAVAPPDVLSAAATDAVMGTATAASFAPDFKHSAIPAAQSPGPFPAQLFRAATLSARPQLFRSHSAAPLSSSTTSTAGASDPIGPASATGGSPPPSTRPAFAVVVAHGSPVTRVACAGRFVLSGDANGGLKVTTLPSSSLAAATVNPNPTPNSNSKGDLAPSLMPQHHPTKPKAATKSPSKGATSSSSMALSGHKTAVTCLAVPTADISPTAGAGAGAASESAPSGTVAARSSGQMAVAAPLFVSGAADGTVKVWNFAAAAHPSHREPVALCEPHSSSLSSLLATTLGQVVGVTKAAASRGLKPPVVGPSAFSLKKGNSFTSSTLSDSRSSAAFLDEDVSVTCVSMGLDAAVVAAGYAHGRVRVWALNCLDQRTPMAGGGTSAGGSSIRARSSTNQQLKPGSSRSTGAPVAKGRVLIDCAAHSLAVRCVRLRYLSDSSNGNDNNNDGAASECNNEQGSDADDFVSRGQLLTGSNDCTASLWDFRVPHRSSTSHVHEGTQSGNNSSSAAVVFGGHCAPVTCLEDGIGSCSGGRDVITGCADGIVRVFDLRQPRLAKLELRSSGGGGDDGICGAASLMALRRVAAAPLPPSSPEVNESTSAERLLSAARNGSVCEWALSTGELLRRWRVGASGAHSNGGDIFSSFRDAPFLAAFSATDSGFVGTSGLGVVQRWDFA